MSAHLAINTRGAQRRRARELWAGLDQAGRMRPVLFDRPELNFPGGEADQGSSPRNRKLFFAITLQF